MNELSINSRTIYIGHVWSISYDNVGNDRSHVSLTNGIATDWKVMEWNGMAFIYTLYTNIWIHKLSIFIRTIQITLLLLHCTTTFAKLDLMLQ